MNHHMVTGGPAFPQEIHTTVKLGPAAASSDTTIELAGGMSLRDYFAAQALIGLISSVEVHYPKIEGYASRAYEVADAMLKQREKK